MARLSGSWNKWGFYENSWTAVIEDKEYLDIAADAIAMSGTVTVTGDLVSTGGQAQSFMFHQNTLMQGQFAAMTASVVPVTSSDTTHKVWTSIPMVRAGSVLGLTLYTDTVIKSGSLSASVTIDGVSTEVIASANTGSSVTMTPVTQNSATFSAGSVIGVALTGSSTYLSEPDVTSASFIATVLVEM